MKQEDFIFHSRFNKALALKGVTARAVSKALGFTEATVSNWRLGKKTPSADNVAEIARFLGVSADYLLGLSDEDRPGAAPSASASGDNAVALSAGRDAINGADSAGEVARLRERNAELEAQIARMADAVTQLSLRVAALSAATPAAGAK